MRNWISSLVLATGFLAGSASAAQVNNFTLAGSIAENVSWTILGLDGANSKMIFSGDGSSGVMVTSADFENGYVEVPNAIEFSAIRSNRAVMLKIQNSGWILPAEYDVGTGPKTVDGADTQLALKVDSSSISSVGTLEALGGFASAFTGVDSTPADFLKLGSISGAGKHSGVKAGAVNFYARVMLDEQFDVPGNYAVNLMLTVAPQS